MTLPDGADLAAAVEGGDHARVTQLTSARLAERPGDDAAHEVRARSLLALGRLDEAERDAADAVRLDPEEIRYRELLAEVRSRRGAHADAAAEYARLARNDPRQVAWTLAEAAERLEDADASGGVDAARRAVRLTPYNFEAQLALARGLVRQGDAREALTAAVRAVELRPGDPAARESLADALWLANRPPDAFQLFGELARELGGPGRARVVAKARTLYRERAGLPGRWLAAIPSLFTFALQRGWVDIR
jgi:tetratricopeptide (TPR) repeat protein